MNARTAAALGLLSASVLGAALGHCRGLRSGMCIGYAHGDRDGHRRGDANARLDMILDAPSLCEHNDQMLRMVGLYGHDVQDEAIRRLIDGIPAVAEVLGQEATS